MEAKHILTQSQLCKCFKTLIPEIPIMPSKYNFELVILLETWLKNNIQLLDRVNIVSLNSEYRNRLENQGGVVSICYKETLKYGVRMDKNNRQNS